jgi:chemotaxis protein methyltransferase CheR
MLLNARQVLDEDGSAAALLLAIEDVTERRNVEREKDELLKQKEVLLQEMQHRVANSLQIIASILLLKARTVQSEEIRMHLQDAHQRVLSVANESIEIGPYLSKLCDSLAKSMIGDRRPLSLSVQATGGAATSSEAVSLGLIVTELVINALKHFQAATPGIFWSSTSLAPLVGAYRYPTTAWFLRRSAMRGRTAVSARVSSNR